MKQRLRAVRKAMRREGLSALAVTNMRNIHYLTGFTGSAGACLISPRSAVFITDFRYRSQAAKQVSADYRRAEHASPIQGIVKELGKTRAKALAFEEAHVTHAVFRQMRKLAKGVRLKPVSGLVEGLRLCKDAGEIQKLRRGARVNAGALSEIAQVIRPGRAETDVALDLEIAMRRRGATGPAFDTIVASGPRSALPHGIASSRKLKKGDLITIDFGAVVSGYHADTTRVFSLGKPSPKGEKIYEIVLEAQMTALEAVKPGALCGDVDKAARDVIDGVWLRRGLRARDGPRPGALYPRSSPARAGREGGTQARHGGDGGARHISAPLGRRENRGYGSRHRAGEGGPHPFDNERTRCFINIFIIRRFFDSMPSTSDFRNGLKIEIDNEPFIIVEFQHVKPGKGGAFVRTKLKNLRTGRVLEKTFRSGESVGDPGVEQKQMQYLYRDGDILYFMDTQTYDQTGLGEEKLGDSMKLLREETIVDILFYKGDAISVEMPTFVELAIKKTEPGVRGDTATGATKQAELETGATVTVPLFLNEGDVLKIDTRTGEYIERVKTA